MKKGLRVLPYILASLILALLVTMVQTLRPTESRAVRAQETARPDYFYLPVGATPASDVTEQEYRDLITEFQTQYMAQVVQKTGKALLIPNEWASPYFAAFAVRREGYFQVSLWGGTVRAPGATKSAMAAMLCHELGHILGGEPLQTIPGSDWASTEGQSDFFAAKVCLPEYFRRHPEMVPLSDVDLQIVKMCSDNVDCERTAQVGWGLVNLFQKYSYREYVPVSLEVHEKPATELIRNQYPSDQCRLDTYLQGALCQSNATFCSAPACWSAPQK